MIRHDELVKSRMANETAEMVFRETAALRELAAKENAT